MNYPIFDPGPMGPSTLIAVVAIIHILIAHFAVGAGIAIPWLEARSIRRNDQILGAFLRRYSRFLILFSFVAGAVTGVGIWFVIALISPEAISLLIRQFVWGWATEWVFFIVEITSGYVYYFYWDKMTPRMHLKVGIVYAISAWLSLFVINGILTFMLTPGRWLATGSFWDGWINPTFWPSLFLRTVSALALAGIFVAVVANLDRCLDREKCRHVIHAGSVFLVPLALMIPLSVWYFAAAPHAASELALGGAIAMTMFFGFGIVASTLVGLYAYFGLIRNRRYINLETALLLAAIAFIATSSMEYVREGIRKPFIVYDYMYANGLTIANVARVNQAGFFAAKPVIAREIDPSSLSEIERGRLIYRVQCQRCHAVDGYNAIRPLVNSWSTEMIRSNTRQLDRLKWFMPPFAGTEQDLNDLVAYLASLRSDRWKYEEATAPVKGSAQ
jgi:cytochrome bd ubiquinol oxidase subunit I